MTEKRWRSYYNDYRDFFETTYETNTWEVRGIKAAGATLVHAFQGAGNWTDLASPNLVICFQRTTDTAGIADFGAGSFQTSRAFRRGVVIAPHTTTSIYAEQPHDILAATIPYENLKKLCPDILPDNGDFGVAHSREFNDPFFFALMERLWLESDVEGSYDRLFAEGALSTMAALLVKLANQKYEASRLRGGLAPWQIRRATELLRDQLSDDISLEDLARQVGLSPFHFSRAFKQSLGAPPHRYRTNLRLERACHLLETTDASVTDIAFLVGYESSQALARTFSRDLGIAPSTWRKERRR